MQSDKIITLAQHRTVDLRGSLADDDDAYAILSAFLGNSLKVVKGCLSRAARLVSVRDIQMCLVTKKGYGVSVGSWSPLLNREDQARNSSHHERQNIRWDF